MLKTAKAKRKKGKYSANHQCQSNIIELKRKPRTAGNKRDDADLTAGEVNTGAQIMAKCLRGGETSSRKSKVFNGNKKHRFDCGEEKKEGRPVGAAGPGMGQMGKRPKKKKKIRQVTQKIKSKRESKNKPD